MTGSEILILLMFLSVCGLLLAGYPVAFTLGGTALLFGSIAWLTGIFDFAFIAAYPDRIYGTMRNDVLIAVPLFVFMGVVLERSRVAEDLLDNMGRLMRGVRGGLGISVSLVGALLAASTGIVGATVVTMGLISLPTMLRRGYDPALATGSIAAAGTLGQIIPPSIVLILLGDVLSSAYQSAQRELGNWSPEPMSVGDLFAGALLPGIGLVVLYILYQIGVAVFAGHKSPAYDTEEDGALDLKEILRPLLPPLALIVAVLGSILGGIATPTEAASVGAIGALLLAAERQAGEKLPLHGALLALISLLLLTSYVDLRLGRVEVSFLEQAATYTSFALLGFVAWGVLVAIQRTLRAGLLMEAMTSTARTTSMVFIILVGAALFSLVFIGLDGELLVRDALAGLPGGTVGAVALVMLVMFALGFFLDFIEITYVVVPIVAPALFLLGLDPVWLGVLMAINLQTSFLTPPFGFALFYLRGVAPSTIPTLQIYKGVIPFVLIQIFALVLLFLVPEAATWLPSIIFD